MSTDFEHRVLLLKKLGVEHQTTYEYRGTGESRHPHDLQVFSRVLLPFTPEEWCGLCMNEGEHYIGGCCGNMSAVQDEINGIFREGGSVSCNVLADIAATMASHDGEDEGGEDFPFGTLAEPLDALVARARDNWESIGPWAKMAVVWQLVRGFYAATVPTAPAKHETPLMAAISILATGLQYVSIAHLFDAVCKGDGWKTDPAPATQRRANDLINLAKLLPALKTLNEGVNELDLGTIEGFALIDKTAGPDEIAKTRRGYCIFETQEQVDEMFATWRRADAEYQTRAEKPIEERIGVRRVRVTMEKGVEFLD